MGDTRPEDVFNILVATDLHLGYAEKDPVRGDDSFNTFEEILQLADKKNVDFVLLGGDLFHENKPSLPSLYRCLALLRKYCMGDKPICIEFLSDQANNFGHCENKIVNYEDPNMNISIPVYSIHGNHDDPAGFGRLSVMDLLSVSGLMNYFGKWTNLNEVEVQPLLMRKGQSKLALYGLSHIKDERLSRLFRDSKVDVVRPSETPEEWMNIFVLHQNRADRGVNNYVQEKMLPSFIDLVVWGHEHECRIDPEWNAEKEFYVTQPGSPVATSLCEGESQPKHVGLLRVFKKKFKLEPIRLKTVRPLVFDTITLSQTSLKDQPDGFKEQKIRSYINEHIETMLEKAQDQLTGDSRQPTLPLIRLRVEYGGEDQMFNPVRFSQTFTDRVANPSDVILLKREPLKNRAKKGTYFNELAIESALSDLVNPGINTNLNIQAVLEKYFTDPENKDMHMRVLSVPGMAEAVSRSIEKDDRDAISDLTMHQMNKTLNYVKSQMIGEDDILDTIETFRQIRLAKSTDEGIEAREMLNSDNRQGANYGMSDDEGDTRGGSDSDDFMSVAIKQEETEGDTSRATSTGTRGRGRGRGGGRGSSNGGATAKGATKAGATTRARGRGSRGGATAKRESANTTVTSQSSLSNSISYTRGATSRKTQHDNIASYFKFSSSPSESPTKRRKIEFNSDSD